MQRFERDALAGLDRCCGEVVVEMLDLIESNDVDIEMAEILLLTSLFPQCTELFQQMQGTNPEYTSQSIKHFKAFLQGNECRSKLRVCSCFQFIYTGPPNRPTEDSQGLLQICLDHFEQQERMFKANCSSENENERERGL